jgi:Domain of unknown function (DUF4873)
MSYEGPALVGDLPVTVHLSGRWEPVDGRYHWGGRIEPLDEVARLVRVGRREVSLRIGDRAADARLAEVDPWGGVRVTGIGAAPWPPLENEGED